MKTLLNIAAAAALTGLCAQPAVAQSIYGCTDLEGRHAFASVEGDGGVFYRVDPDLRMFHPLSDETVDQLARLSEALASLGTTLVYVPLPTKSLAMPDQLPQKARDFGFDASVATTVYGDAIKRLREKGVAAADVRRALRAGVDEPLSFYQTDYRLTSAGARRAARAIADTMGLAPGFVDLPKGRFDTRSTGMVAVPSDMRAALQRHCLIELPLVETEAFEGTRLQAAATGDKTLFGSGSAVGANVALVGDEVTGDVATSLPGFLSEFSGLSVLQYSVAGGGSYAAISSYLTSREFQDQRPAYLVWTNPVENNLARYGDQPMRELIAAAGGNCQVPLRLLTGGESNSVTVDLSVLDPSQSYTLFVDADGTPASEARFDFQAASGLVRTKFIHRHPDQVKTGRFYMPLSGLWPEGVQTADIVLDVPYGADPRVTACFD